MEHARGQLGLIREKVSSHNHILFLLDIDGTLAPIALRPEDARVPEETKRTLSLLGRLPGCHLALITGRSVSDARHMLKVDEAIYAGNHGLEMEKAGWKWVHPVAESLRPELSRVVADLVASEMGKTPGLRVEDKGLSVSIHYREVRDVEPSAVRSWVKTIVEEHRDVFRLASGKKVVEIRPRVPCDKGTAVNHIRATLDPLGQALVIYSGDDQTDEDAFAALRPGDFGIRVGYEPRSGARYFVRDPGEVAALLGEIATWRMEIAAQCPLSQR